MRKETLYTSAWSPLFSCFVKIERAHEDARGEMIYVCSNAEHGLNNHLFREYELTRFTI